MKLDPGSTLENPSVAKTARKSIWWVAVEVVLGTALLGWAMLSLPPTLKPMLIERYDDMLTVLAEQYGTIAMGTILGKSFGVATAIIA